MYLFFTLEEVTNVNLLLRGTMLHKPQSNSKFYFHAYFNSKKLFHLSSKTLHWVNPLIFKSKTSAIRRNDSLVQPATWGDKITLGILKSCSYRSTSSDV